MGAAIEHEDFEEYIRPSPFYLRAAGSETIGPWMDPDDAAQRPTRYELRPFTFSPRPLHPLTKPVERVMAGNEFTKVVPCIECGARAQRTGEGVETDEYVCERGHYFLIDWSHGPQPTAPLWPPSKSAK
jgi:hypothetical protein